MSMLEGMTRTGVVAVALSACVSAALAEGGFPSCGDPANGSCFALHPTGGCADGACCNAVCAIDSFCCDTEWDYLCRQMAVENCNPPVPANDGPDGAALVFAGLVAFDTVGATDSSYTALPVGCGGVFGNEILRDVWYEYRAGRDGVAEISTCPLPGTGARSDFDSILVVRDAVTLAPIVCNDESSFCGGFAVLEFPIQRGQRYLVQIGGHDEFVGQGAMLVEETGAVPAAPSNDACLGALPAAVGGITQFDLLGAARDGAQCADTGVDVWFVAGPSKSNGVMRLRACSSDGDVALECMVDSCDAPRICSIGSTCDATSALSVEVAPGEVVLVRVAGASGIEGTLDIAFEEQAACPADFNQDGNVNAADVTLLLSSWGSAGGDVNGDGTTNATDLAELLLSWGLCS